MAHPELPDCAWELLPGWVGAVAVWTPSVGLPSQVELFASPEWALALELPVPATARAMAGPLPPAVAHWPGTTARLGTIPWLPRPDWAEAVASPPPETATAAAGAEPLPPGEAATAAGCGRPSGDEEPAEADGEDEEAGCDEESDAGCDEGSDDEDVPDPSELEEPPGVFGSLFVLPRFFAHASCPLVAEHALRSAGRTNIDRPLPPPKPVAGSGARGASGATGCPGICPTSASVDAAATAALDTATIDVPAALPAPLLLGARLVRAFDPG
jgi:hypothetical protein